MEIFNRMLYVDLKLQKREWSLMETDFDGN